MNHLDQTFDETLKIRVETPEAMSVFGTIFAGLLCVNDVVALDGDLGVGKTYLSASIGRALGIPQPVVSPTFALLSTYQIPQSEIQTLYHFDVYRLQDETQFLDAGFDEYLEANGICLIEWACLIQSILPERTWWIKLKKCMDHDASSVAETILDAEDEAFEFAAIIQQIQSGQPVVLDDLQMPRMVMVKADKTRLQALSAAVNNLLPEQGVTIL